MYSPGSYTASNTMRNQKQKSSRSANRKSRITQHGPSTPPMLKTDRVIKTTTRYVSTGTTQLNTSLQRILASGGAVNYAANTAAVLATSFRIKKIEIWSAPTPGASLTFIWNPVSLYSRTIEYNSICESTAKPAHLVIRPDPNSLYHNWMGASSGAVNVSLFSLATTVAGTVLDLTIEYVLYDGDNLIVQSTVTTTAAGTAGNMYYTPLDGTTGQWAPQGLITLV